MRYIALALALLIQSPVFASFQTDDIIYANKVRLAGSGNVGIGTSSPSALLDIGGGTRNFVNGTYDGLIKGSLEVDNHVYVQGNLFALTNVGIGSAQPRGALDVDGYIYGNGSQLTGLPAGYADANAQSATGWIKSTDTVYLTIGTNTVVMQGNIGIGSASPQQKLDVEGTVYFGTLGSGLVRSTAGLLSADSTIYQQQLNGTGLVRAAGTAITYDSTVYQPQLNGTGLVRAAGTAITYDNTVYQINNAQWTTSGTNIYSTLAGNVGIGSTTPAQKLDVTGTAKATSGIFGTTTLSAATITNSTGAIGFDNENLTTTGTLNAGTTTLSLAGGNASSTLLNLNQTSTPTTGQTAQTADLVFNLTQSINSVASLHEAAKISAYKVSDWFHASTEADVDSGLKFYTTKDGTPTLQLTMDEAGAMTAVGTFNSNDITISGTAPKLTFYDTDGTANLRKVKQYLSKDDGYTYWHAQVVNDAGTNLFEALTIDLDNMRIGLNNVYPSYDVHVGGTFGVGGHTEFESGVTCQSSLEVLGTFSTYTLDSVYEAFIEQVTVDEFLVSPNIKLTMYTVTALGADTNGLMSADNSVERISATGAHRTVNGINYPNNQRDGHVLILINVGSTYNILFTNENASATAADRVITIGGGTITVAPNGIIKFIYDGTTERWRQF